MSNVERIRAINRDWADPGLRRAFEQERGFPPRPAFGTDEWELQRMAGVVEEYDRQFWEWSRARFDASSAECADAA